VQMTTIAIVCTTGVYASLFSRLSGRKGTKLKIGVARIECPNTQRQKSCEEEGGDGERLLAAAHGFTSFRSRRFSKSLRVARKIAAGICDRRILVRV
jgi:hypothetical protein